MGKDTEEDRALDKIKKKFHIEYNLQGKEAKFPKQAMLDLRDDITKYLRTFGIQGAVENVIDLAPIIVDDKKRQAIPVLLACRAKRIWITGITVNYVLSC